MHEIAQSGGRIVFFKKEKDEGSRDRLKRLEKQLAEAKEQSTKLKAQWQNEKASINAIGVVNGQLEQAKLALEKAERGGDLNTAAQIQYGTIPELQRKLAAAEKAAQQQSGGKRLLSLEVTEEDIAKVVASWTGIPVTRMLEGERQKLVKMEERLSDRVIGQREAIHAVANAAIVSWPSAPMLNRPQRKPTATARPVKIRGVA